MAAALSGVCSGGKIESDRMTLKTALMAYRRLWKACASLSVVHPFYTGQNDSGLVQRTK
jgi:hypothetical protein